MRHRKSGKTLGRNPSHRRALFNNLLTSFLLHERITTTDVKAKELKRLADRMITLGKKATLASRRHAARRLRLPEVVAKLFDELAPRFEGRSGGYSRIVRLGRRKGDNAPMVLIELLSADEKVTPREIKAPVASGAVTTKEQFEETSPAVAEEPPAAPEVAAEDVPEEPEATEAVEVEEPEGGDTEEPRTTN